MSDQITEARRHLTELQEDAAHPKKVDHTLDDFLNGEVFFDLMQAYRHTSIANQREVVAAYEAVKKAIQEVVRG